MLDVKITVDENKIVLENLERLGNNLKPAAMRAVERVAGGTYDGAMQWLSGPGGQTRSYSREWSAGGEVRKKKQYGAAPGGYPVPVRTGHLRRSLAWLAPGQSKSGDVGTVTAGEDEFIIFDSASYALQIFEGTGSSAAYGPRNAILDSFEMFNRSGQIQQLVGEEVRKEIDKNA